MNTKTQTLIDVCRLLGDNLAYVESANGNGHYAVIAHDRIQAEKDLQLWKYGTCATLYDPGNPESGYEDDIYGNILDENGKIIAYMAYTNMDKDFIIPLKNTRTLVDALGIDFITNTPGYHDKGTVGYIQLGHITFTSHAEFEAFVRNIDPRFKFDTATGELSIPVDGAIGYSPYLVVAYITYDIQT